MRSNGLFRPIPMVPARAPSSVRSQPSLIASAFLAMAQTLDPDEAAQRELEEALVNTRGLASLLELSRKFPPREPLDVDDLDPDDPATSGFGQLLRAARARAQVPPPGAQP